MKRFRLRAGLAISAALAVVMLQVMGASAQAVTCRTDPAVLLSNGTTITLYENITDSATDVTSIKYALHVPVGVKALSIIYYGPVPASAQSLTLYQDENPGNYDGYATVYTKTSSIPVTAYASADVVVSCQTAGHSGQLLHSHLHFL